MIFNTDMTTIKHSDKINQIITLFVEKDNQELPKNINDLWQ